MMTCPMPHSTWLEIDLPAITYNVRRLKQIAGTRLMAVVKANACGHGAVEVARTVKAAGADWIGVARAEEGLALRRAAIDLPILVLGYTPPAVAAEAITNDLSLTVYDAQLARAYGDMAVAQGLQARVHLKVDTGLGRLGVSPQDAAGFLQTLRAFGLIVEGIFTHLATADWADQTYAGRQLSIFEDVLCGLGQGQIASLLIHTANSAATLSLPHSRFDLVRTGIAMYGLHPSDEVRCPEDFRPALTWKTVVTHVHTLPTGSAVGYGRDYITRGPTRIAVIPLGYADGFRRQLPGGQRSATQRPSR